MRRAKRPLNQEAVKKANEAVAAETSGRPLTMGPEDAEFRKKWMDAYVAEAGPDSYTETSQSPKKVGSPVAECPANRDGANWVELKYLYCDDTPVARAKYEVIDTDTGQEFLGTLDDDGYCYVDLPVNTTNIEYNFYNDPVEVEVRRRPVENPERLKVKPGWFDSMEQGIRDTGEWVWGTVQGDFNEDQTVGQIAVNTAITMIPIVDQVADVRDVVANLKLLIFDKRYNDKWVWIALVLTLIGLIPTLGSLVKGVGKALVKGIKTAADIPIKKMIEVVNKFYKGDAIKKLHEILDNFPQYGEFAKEKLAEILTELISKLDQLAKYLPGELADKAKDAKATAEHVLSESAKKIDEAIKELQAKLRSVLDEKADFKQKGSTKAENTRKQVESDPPDLDTPMRPNVRNQYEQNKVKAEKARAQGNEPSAIGYETENKVIDEQGASVVNAGEDVSYTNSSGKTVETDIDVETGTQVIQVKSGKKLPSPNQTEATVLHAEKVGKKPVVMYNKNKVPPKALMDYKKRYPDVELVPRDF